MGVLKKQNPSNSLCMNIVIGGEAGHGIKSSGKIIATALIKSGFEVFIYDEYPSLIRGGHNMVSITYSPYPIYSQVKKIDILICLDRRTFEEHKYDLDFGSLVIYDASVFNLSDSDLKSTPCEVIDISAEAILRKFKLPEIMRNTILSSSALCMAGVEKKNLNSALKNVFGAKSKALALNLQAAEEGYETSSEYFNLKKYSKASNVRYKKQSGYLISGNHAVALGALRAGLGFYSAYPMTPASTILDILFEELEKYNIVVKQAEDEIAAINMAIGASFAGARSMVGTSGGGFSLMVEGLGLAAITETPLVIVLSQRPGPATGLPTWTAQGDLLFALYASQDEFPRIILTPTDIEECFYLTFLAFNLADKYQIPVFILLDKYLSESLQLIKFQEAEGFSFEIDRGLLMNDHLLSRIDDFKRYEFTETGISPRSIPMQENGIFLANSDESDEYGYSTESAKLREKNVRKRFQKTSDLLNAMPELNVYGDIKSKVALLTWGSPKGAILEAMRRLHSLGIKTKLMALNFVEPFPVQEVESFIEKTKATILIENNYTSQLGTLINQYLGVDIEYKFLKYDGRPIFPEEIVEFILELSR